MKLSWFQPSYVNPPLKASTAKPAMEIGLVIGWWSNPRAIFAFGCFQAPDSNLPKPFCAMLTMPPMMTMVRPVSLARVRKFCILGEGSLLLLCWFP